MILPVCKNIGVGGGEGGGGGGGACMHLTSSFRLQGYLEVQEASELGKKKQKTPYEDRLQTMYSHALHQSAPLRGIGKGTVDFECHWHRVVYNACSKSKEILCSALQPKQDDDTKIVQNNATPACCYTVDLSGL